MRNDPAWLLLHSRPTFWERVRRDEDTVRDVARLAVFMILAGAAYGTVLAGWRSPRLALYVAAKLPLLFLGTSSIVMVFNWIVAAAAGSGLKFRQVVAITYGAMGIACWILLSLVPVALFFTFCVAERTGTNAELRLTHNCLLLTHISLIAFAGLAGNAALRRGLKATVPSTCSSRRVYWGWIASFAIVGCQLSWMLRPFVGSPFYDVRFMRPDALDRNFFEFVLGDVLPYVLKGGG
jgi:hypothetical protein